MAYGALSVLVVSAENLTHREGALGGKNDPYCVVMLDGSTQKFKTKTIKEAGSACLWEERTQFNVIEGQSTLVVAVYEQDSLFRDELIGSGTFDLKDVFHNLGAPLDKWVPIVDKKTRPSGQVRLVLSFQGQVAGQGDGNINAAGKYALPSWSAAAINVQAVNAFQKIQQQVSPAPPGYNQAPPPAQASPPQHTAPPSYASMPYGWEEKRDATGKPYYVNHQTQTTQWERPTAHPAAAVAPPPVTASGGPLPIGWEERCTPQGKAYFVNHQTQATQWERPTASAHAALGALPPGWEEVLDPTTGKMFYAHAASKTTSWERPTQ